MGLFGWSWITLTAWPNMRDADFWKANNNNNNKQTVIRRGWETPTDENGNTGNIVRIGEMQTDRKNTNCPDLVSRQTGYITQRNNG